MFQIKAGYYYKLRLVLVTAINLLPSSQWDYQTGSKSFCCCLYSATTLNYTFAWLILLLLVVHENVFLRSCVHRHMLSLIFPYATKALLTSYDLKHLLHYTVACRVIKVSLLLLLLDGWR